jgi:hypothetical protein
MTIRFLLYLVLLTLIVLIALLRFKKMNRSFNVLTILIACTLISEITSRILAVKYHNSSPVYHALNLISFTGYGLIYYFLMKNPARKRFVIVVMVSACLFSIFNSIFLQNLWSFPSNALSILCLSNIFFSLLLFGQMLNESDPNHAIRRASVLFNCSVLVFFTVIFLHWSFYNYLVRNKMNSQLISQFMFYANVLYYMMLGTALFFSTKKISQTLP